ncbi:hypothetical protein TYRP_015756 [Tyrophagus putrescentiae]|nr:hypothetical protein TYRP_015756 [Tyrophagus putrescentiae]
MRKGNNSVGSAMYVVATTPDRYPGNIFATSAPSIGRTSYSSGRLGTAMVASLLRSYMVSRERPNFAALRIANQPLVELYSVGECPLQQTGWRLLANGVRIDEAGAHVTRCLGAPFLRENGHLGCGKLLLKG